MRCAQQSKKMTVFTRTKYPEAIKKMKQMIFMWYNILEGIVIPPSLILNDPLWKMLDLILPERRWQMSSSFSTSAKETRVLA